MRTMANAESPSAKLAPQDSTRSAVLAAVGLSVLAPGLGHLVIAKRQADAIFWFVICQVLLFGGFYLAGGTQGDYALALPFGIKLILPEVINFLGAQFASTLIPSLEHLGRSPEMIASRNLGHLLSGASGVLSAFAAAHAASCVLEKEEPLQAGLKPMILPRAAALLTLLCPGLGHAKTGRTFKAKLFFVSIMGLFFLGMLLGDWADFDRQRHAYYWAGQMFIGLPGWLTAWACSGVSMDGVPAYLDAGLLFTTAAGFFNAIASLDAYHRCEQDYLALRQTKQTSVGGQS